MNPRDLHRQISNLLYIATDLLTCWDNTEVDFQEALDHIATLEVKLDTLKEGLHNDR